MRKVIDLQQKIWGKTIDTIELDIESRDEIPKVLIGLQHIYKTPELLEEIIEILKDIPQKSMCTGRRGMDLWNILVLATLRLSCNWDYDKVCEIANEHRTVRIFLGHPDGDFSKRYPLQTIKDNVSLLIPEILDRVSFIVVLAGHTFYNRKSMELKCKCDSFVVETDVHYPTDLNLLFDSIRKIITIISGICFKVGISDWRQSKHNLKSIKKIFNKARKVKRSTSNDPGKKSKKEALVFEAYQTYIDIVEDFIFRAEITYRKLLDQFVLSASDQVRLLQVEQYMDDADKIINQIQRRVFNGEKIPHDEKIFSIFERHTEWICKGKAGMPQELGMRVSIMNDQFGFIVHHQVMEKQTDDKVAVSMVENATNKFTNIKSCSFDKGYYSPDNLDKLQEILDTVVMPRKGRLSQKAKEEESSEAFIKLRRNHSGIESAINALENHGLDRCPDHGLHGFKRYVGLAVLARNIQLLGHVIQKKELEKVQKQKRAA